MGVEPDAGRFIICAPSGWPLVAATPPSAADATGTLVFPSQSIGSATSADEWGMFGGRSPVSILLINNLSTVWSQIFYQYVVAVWARKGENSCFPDIKKY